MSVPTCTHVKQNGAFCDSPAVRGRKYCYFHLNLRGRRLKASRARRQGVNVPLDIPFPEDMYAVQISLHEITRAVLEQRIDHKSAGLALYSLQQAAANISSTLAWLDDDSFEENHATILSAMGGRRSRTRPLPPGGEIPEERGVNLNEIDLPPAKPPVSAAPLEACESETKTA
jgi:hypothetical protein